MVFLSVENKLTPKYILPFQYFLMSKDQNINSTVSPLLLKMKVNPEASLLLLDDSVDRTGKG